MSFMNPKKNPYDMQSIPVQQFKIKKRANEFSNEVLKKTTTHDGFLPFAYGDRFIPRRYNASDWFKAQSYTPDEPNEKIDIFGKVVQGYWRQSGMRDCLNMEFGIKAKQKVLNLHDWITESICRASLNRRPTMELFEQRFRNEQKLDWACVSRARPIAFADSTHDLPGFNHFSHLNIIDWSCSGKIAASFGYDLVLWMPDANATTVYRLEGIKSLKHSPDGTMLAVGVKRKQSEKAEIQVWNVQSKGIYIIKYHVYDFSNLEVRCITWNRKQTFILCGMSTGHIYVHNFPSLTVEVVLFMHLDAITIIQLSVNQKYFASCDITGYVLVWHTETFKPFIKCMEDSESFVAWHPWKEDEMIVATTLPGKIRLINITSRSVVAYYRRTDKSCRIDAITFNPLSAELVVSVALVTDEGVENEILVMSSMDRVVDRLSVHEKSVHFLLWDPTSTKLATAGDDETLHIWNFFAYPNLRTLIKRHLPQKKTAPEPFGATASFLNMR